MRLFLLISVLVSSASAQCRFCSGACIFDEFQELALIRSGLTKVFDMAYSTLLNMVFFTYNDYNESPVRRLGYVKLASGVRSYVEEKYIKKPHGLTIDTHYDILYIGTPTGLYKLALYTEKMIPIKIGPSVKMLSVFYDPKPRNLLFITNDRKLLLLDMTFMSLQPASDLRQWQIDKMVVDKHDNLLYIDYEEKLVYTIKHMVMVRTLVPNSDNATDIALDPELNAYIAKPDGIYKHNGLTNELVFLGDNLANVQRLTFQKENDPIFNVDDKIIMLSHKKEPRSGPVKI